MNKKYRFSEMQRILHLGFKKYGAEIDGNILILRIFDCSNTVYSSLKKIPIENIEQVDYETGIVYFDDVSGKGIAPTLGRGFAPVKLYVICMKDNLRYSFPYSYLNTFDLQDLLNEIKKINPRIKYSDKISEFLQRKIYENKKLHFDFEVHKGKFLENDYTFAQDYPSLDTLIGLFIIFVFLVIPATFGVFGNQYLLNIYGQDYLIYKNIIIVLSGISLSVAFMNILMALGSQYLGHKITVVAISIFVGFLLIGVM